MSCRREQQYSRKEPPAPELRLYGTGWMVADALSSDDSDGGSIATAATTTAMKRQVTIPATSSMSGSCVAALALSDLWPMQRRQRKRPVASMSANRSAAAQADAEWDGTMSVAGECGGVRIERMARLLATQFAFLSGSKTPDGYPILTFPDRQCQIDFDDYQLLLNYLLIGNAEQLPRCDNHNRHSTRKNGRNANNNNNAEEDRNGNPSDFVWPRDTPRRLVEAEAPTNDANLWSPNLLLPLVVIVDRRADKWSSVRQLFTFITAFFPVQIRVIFLLKPEGVLQRALEVGYRNLFTTTTSTIHSSSTSSSYSSSSSSQYSTSLVGSGSESEGVGPAGSGCQLVDGRFKVVLCPSVAELHRYLGVDGFDVEPVTILTPDLGGTCTHYNHEQWCQQRMDIERMKCSVGVIAESLSDFGKCLRETELPNDVETTERLLRAQSAERDAIKEDFRISIRKGVTLLRELRRCSTTHSSRGKPHYDNSRCQSAADFTVSTGTSTAPASDNNTHAVERMLAQLEETERSFDTFWRRHESRLVHCLKLRKFEDQFRRLQVCFGKHMLHLEEHREVGNCVESAERLAEAHAQYAASAMEDVEAARQLRSEGDALMTTDGVAESTVSASPPPPTLPASNDGTSMAFSAPYDSLAPKCDELTRMADALAGALKRRAGVLRLSRDMHQQIAEANCWCRRGVTELLAFDSAERYRDSQPASSTVANSSFYCIGDAEHDQRLGDESAEISTMVERLDRLLTDGESLQLDMLKRRKRHSAVKRPSSALSAKAPPISSSATTTNREDDEDNRTEDDDGQLILLTTTDTSSLLAQVAERIDDIRRLGAARRDALRRQQLNGGGGGGGSALNTATVSAARPSTSAVMSASPQPPKAALRSRFSAAIAAKKPIQVVSPEKKNPDHCASANASPTLKKPEIQVLHRDAAADVERHHLRRGSADGSSATSSLASSVDDAAGCFADSERCYASADDYAGGCRTTPSSSSACSTSTALSKRIDYILEELLSTEESYVSELDSLVEFYVRPFEALEHSPMFPTTLRGQSETLFGNICDLAAFHRRYVLSDLRRYCAKRQVTDACRLFVSQRNNFLALYRPYCQNKPLSETLRASVAESGASDHHHAAAFFAECQRRAGHPLPLGAYLLKPIQRITKYQLLLKEMRKQYGSAADDDDTEKAAERREVDAALTAMLDLLTQLNSDMQQLHILGFAGDLRLFGALRLQTESEVYAFKRKNHRLANKPQRRHLLLFDGGILFCKRRTQAAVSGGGGNGSTVGDVSEYFEHKLCIPIQNLGFAECSKWSADRFEVWDETRNDGYAVRIMPVADGDAAVDDDAEEKCRAKWVARLARLTTLHAQRNHNACAPHTSTSLNRHSYVSGESYQGGGLKPAERQYGSGVPLYGNNGSSGACRPQSWTSSDGSCGNGPVMSLSSSGTPSSRSSDVTAGQDGPLGTGDGTTPVCETRSDANGNNNDTTATASTPAASARQFGAIGRILTNAAKCQIDVENNFTTTAVSPAGLHRFPSSATMSGMANTVSQHSGYGSGGIHTSRSLQINVSSSLQNDFRSSSLKSADTTPKTELIAK